MVLRGTMHLLEEPCEIISCRRFHLVDVHKVSQPSPQVILR